MDTKFSNSQGKPWRFFIAQIYRTVYHDFYKVVFGTWWWLRWRRWWWQRSQNVSRGSWAARGGCGWTELRWYMGQWRELLFKWTHIVTSKESGGQWMWKSICFDVHAPSNCTELHCQQYTWTAVVLVISYNSFRHFQCEILPNLLK